MKKYVEAIENFWTRPQPLFLSSLFRLAVGSTLTWFYFIRFLDFEWLYSEKGLVPYTLAVTMVPDFFKPPFFFFPESESLLYILHILFVLGLFLMALGIGGRILSIIVFILHSLFAQRNSVIIYGPDFIASCWLLYMCLLKTDAYLTLPQLLKKKDIMPKTLSESALGDKVNSIGVRFIQIQLCIIYAYGGMEKLRGITWWRGDAIWVTLANGQLVTKDLSFLAHVPLLVAIATFTTLMWEVYFPVIIWYRKTRLWVLGFGILLHVIIGYSMNIVGFSLLMISSYILFLNLKPDPQSLPKSDF